MPEKTKSLFPDKYPATAAGVAVWSPFNEKATVLLPEKEYFFTSIVS
ncbi:hypothetical protein PND81_05500 [Flavonifractor plautii]|nr:hypothetical protein [Flavonifractor plautii]MDB7900759.1 hypothetical protein [Flavonifractor plautii]